jgi:hypothetical protein
MESGSPATSTYQRRPEDVVASNGREVEQFATEACVARQNSGLLVPPPRIPPQMLDEAYERCDEVTGEYAKTFYLGTKLMTQEKQRAIWAIYVWCRRTDELVDWAQRVAHHARGAGPMGEPPGSNLRGQARGRHRRRAVRHPCPSSPWTSSPSAT